MDGITYTAGEVTAVIAVIIVLVALVSGVMAVRRRGERDHPAGDTPDTVPGDASTDDAPGTTATDMTALETPAPEKTPPMPPGAAPADGTVDEGVVPDPVPVETPEAATSRFGRLRSRLQGTLGVALVSIFNRGTLSPEDWDELEEALLMADVGAGATEELLTRVRERLRTETDMPPQAVLREELLAIVDPSLDRSLALDQPGDGGVATAVVVGVNGVGKTTSVGKIARVLVADGYSVMLGAADTFRAAAADQLETWGSRVGVPVVRSDREGADPASVAFDAADKARTAKKDVLLVDTAGRLQNKQGLMDELGKVIRVVSKVRPPSEVLLVLDATTGQNGLAQAKVFGEVAPLTGIVLTKMDGTARGGIVVAVQRELGVPVKFIGLGEGPDDLAPFDAAEFVDGLLGQ